MINYFKILLLLIAIIYICTKNILEKKWVINKLPLSKILLVQYWSIFVYYKILKRLKNFKHFVAPYNH